MGKIVEKKHGNFDVLKHMANNSGDKIQACGSNNIVSVDIKKNTATITIGITKELANNILDNKMMIGLYCIDKNEFIKVEKELR